MRQIIDQDYRPLEVLLVDDGSAALKPALRSIHPDLQLLAAGNQPAAASNREPQNKSVVSGVVTRFLVFEAHIDRRKRTPPTPPRAMSSCTGTTTTSMRRIASAPGCADFAGDAELTALELSFVVSLPRFDVYEATAASGDAHVILWSSPYRTPLGRRLGFANVSLGEDIHFADRAVRGCRQMLVVRGVQSMYTHHEGHGLSNTYRGVDVERMLRGRPRRAASPPA